MITTEQQKEIDHDLLLDLLFYITGVCVSLCICFIIFLYHHETLFPILEKNLLSGDTKEISLVVLVLLSGLICYWPFWYISSKSRRVDSMSELAIYSYDDIRRDVGLSYDKRNITPKHRPDEKEIHSSKIK
jgi:hypothetical protein